MSRAFIREDVDPPERSGRKRAPSGLPPGAVIYITARGAARLQEELPRLRGLGDNVERVAELEQILGSVKIVDPPDTKSQSVTFGATVTVNDAEGQTETYTVVGVDELDCAPNAVSASRGASACSLPADDPKAEVAALHQTNVVDPIAHHRQTSEA